MSCRPQTSQDYAEKDDAILDEETQPKISNGAVNKENVKLLTCSRNNITPLKVKIQLHTHCKQEKAQYHWKMQHTHKGTEIPFVSHPSFFSHTHKQTTCRALVPCVC